MKKKNCLYLAALAMVATACSNEDDSVLNGIEPASEVRLITETVTATNGDNQAATRAAIADADAAFTWSEGDQIAAHVSDGKYYTTAALAAGESGSATAAFTLSYAEDGARDAFAVFPASIVAADAANYGQEGAALNVTLPASYTLAQVSGTATPCPMVAVNNHGEPWEFKQLCAMLRLTLNGIPPSASYLTIDFNGTKVQGDFAIESPIVPGTSVIATTTTEGNDDIITITDLGISAWTDGMVLNLPLPTGDYTEVTVTAYNSSNEAVITFTRPLKASGTYTAQRAYGRKVTASAPVFSISSGTRVFFAPGNLQATTEDLGDNWTWSFAENQYDYIGFTSHNPNSANQALTGSGKTSANGIVDMFYKSVTGNYYGIHTASPQNNDTFVDWGGLAIGTYPANYWRTLTQAEWLYVIDSRSAHATVNGTANARYTKAVVNGVNGMIFFPDFYEGPTADVESDIVWKDINVSASGWSTTCTLDGWNILEKAGCVFLPAFCRLNYGSTVWEDGKGFYITQTKLNVFKFYAGGAHGTTIVGSRAFVRLVHVIN